MSKAKAAQPKQEEQEEKVVVDVLKHYSDNFTKASEFRQRKQQIISISPKIDAGLGGGILEGTTTILTGLPKIGKTTTCIHIAKQAQRPEYNINGKTRRVFFSAVEARMRDRDLSQPGLDLENFEIIESKPGKILSAEENLSIVERVIHQIEGAVVIVDSFSALCTDAEMTGGMDKMQRADGAKLLAKFFRKVSNVIPVNRIILLGITHQMGNPTGYGAAIQEKGGFALGYQVDFKLRAKSTEPWVVTGNTSQIGQKIEWQVVCSALGPPGNIINPSYLRYGEGIDVYAELLECACDFGIIKKGGGGWHTFTFLPGDKDDEKPKFQGLDKTRQALLENPEWYSILRAKFDAMIGLKCK